MNSSIAPYSAMLSHRISSLLIIIAITTCVLLYQTYTPYAVTMIADASYADTTYAQLKDTLAPAYVARLPIEVLYKKVNSMVISATSLAVHHDRPYHATVIVKTMFPCAVINNQYVLTCNAVLVPISEYALTVVDKLPHVRVLEEFFSQESRSACAAWVQQLPLEVIDVYNIVWYARSHVELVPHEMPSCVLIVWSKTHFSAEVIRAMSQVLQKNTRIDLRVPHYAIVSPILRGNL